MDSRKLALVGTSLLVGFLCTSLQPQVASAGGGAGLVAPAPQSSASTDNGTSCESTPYPSPPSNFDPSLATADELAQYGFPPRPSGDPTTEAVTNWISMVTSAKIQDTLSAPDCVPSSTALKLDTYGSGNWAGRRVPTSYVNATTFTFVESTFTVPALRRGNSAYSQCTPTSAAPGVGLWAGIGIYNVIQTGTVSCQTNTPFYTMFNEDYPQGVHFVGPAVSPGDTVSVEAQYAGGDVCKFFETNDTTGHYMNPVNNSCVNHAGNYAEWIAERLSGSPDFYLPGFATSRQSSNYMGNSSNTYGLDSGSSSNDEYIMTSNCQLPPDGTLLSEPGSISNTDHGFDQVYYASSPITDKCPG